MPYPVHNITKLKVPLRAPEKVMRLERLGASFQSRLSFIRILMRRMQSENWRIDRPKFNIDKNGVGVAVYRVSGPDRTYSLVAFAHDLPDDQRSDRVIAAAWDATFALVDGDVDAADIRRLASTCQSRKRAAFHRKNLRFPGRTDPSGCSNILFRNSLQENSQTQI